MLHDCIYVSLWWISSPFLDDARTRSGQNNVDTMQQSVLNYYYLYIAKWTFWAENAMFNVCFCVLCFQVEEVSSVCTIQNTIHTHTNALRHSHMKDILLWYLLHKRQEFLDSFCRFGCMHVYLWYVPCVTFYIWCQIHWSWCSGPIKQSSYAIAMNSQ